MFTPTGFHVKENEKKMQNFFPEILGVWPTATNDQNVKDIRNRLRDNRYHRWTTDGRRTNIRFH